MWHQAKPTTNKPSVLRHTNIVSLIDIFCLFTIFFFFWKFNCKEVFFFDGFGSSSRLLKWRRGNIFSLATDSICPHFDATVHNNNIFNTTKKLNLSPLLEFLWQNNDWEIPILCDKTPQPFLLQLNSTQQKIFTKQIYHHPLDSFVT